MSLPVAMSQVSDGKEHSRHAATRRQARCARRMHVGKIKYRDQHRAENRARTLDRGSGAEHMTSTLDRGGSAEHMADILRRSDHAEDRANTLERGGAEHMTDMLRQGALAAPERIRSKNERDSLHRALRGATGWCATL